MEMFAKPVQDMLHFPNNTSAAWAVFDVEWYVTSYAPDIVDHTPRSVRQFYLEQGQGLGHSPNVLFDEVWHLHRYPRVAEAVRAGQFASAFDAYCREGFHGRSPHWLFDEAGYRARYPDLTEDLLQSGQFANAYDHFLRVGQRTGRLGHMLFDPIYYQAQLDSSEACLARHLGAYTHYLRRLASGQSEPRTSEYFDPNWYRTTCNVTPTGSEPTGALRSYLCGDPLMQRDPLPAFSEAYYRARYSDVVRALDSGRYRNGYAHFLAVGVGELRSPSELIDLAWYAAQEPVARDLQRGRVPNAFVHLLTIGRAQGQRVMPPGPTPPTEAQANELASIKSGLLMPAIGQNRLDFTCMVKPELSVIVIMRNQFAITLSTLASLRGQCPADTELILVDSGSDDECDRADIYVPGVHLLRFDRDVGFASGCNAALHFVSADTVLLLNTATDLAPGSVAAAMHWLASVPQIGAVGGKVVRPHGLLHAAGNILWRDGSATNYLHGSSPLAPEANFVRQVDFCSTIFLMLRSTLFRALGGLDPAFMSADCTDADLGVRIAAAGFSVVYDPGIATFHTPLADTAVASAQLAFQRKHFAQLRFRYIADERVQVFARFTGKVPRRLLFIEDSVPLRMTGSGFVRSNDILRVMVTLGYQVTVFPMLCNRFELAHIYSDMPDSVEVMHNLSFNDLTDFLLARSGYYDVIWVARSHNLDGIRPILERTISGTGRPPMIVLDTEAVAATRDAIRAELVGEPPIDVDAAIMQEMANASLCQSIVVVTEHEAAKLTQLGFPDVAVIGHMRELQPTPKSFDQRAGLLFVGAIHQMDSPNYDSLCWFVDQVLPFVEESLGWETRLTVIGFTSVSVTMDRFRHHPRVVLRGAVANLEPAYNQHRIFVAPTRFAAGVAYKVHEAASFGVPIVATQLLADQLEWVDGRELLAADAREPERFARQIVTLYRDADLWTGLREAALERLRYDNNHVRYVDAVRHVIGSA